MSPFSELLTHLDRRWPRLANPAPRFVRSERLVADWVGK
jgi:hypothetical protein